MELTRDSVEFHTTVPAQPTSTSTSTEA
jgi:hypothetical protein